MTDDPMALFRAMRPEPPSPNSPDIRRAQATTTNGRLDLHSLAMVPGSPGYNSRIPRPPCWQCGEDHNPGVDYGHEWKAEPVHADAPVSAAPRHAAPAPIDVQPVPAGDMVLSQRVALYVGRGETYVIAIEKAPDWDADVTLKVDPSMVVPMLELVKALGVKISDKTGGDLVMLRQEAEDARREHAQAYVRSAESAGGGGARRQGDAADQSPADLPQGVSDETRGLPEPRGERADPAE